MSCSPSAKLDSQQELVYNIRITEPGAVKFDRSVGGGIAMAPTCERLELDGRFRDCEVAMAHPVPCKTRNVGVGDKFVHSLLSY